MADINSNPEPHAQEVQQVAFLPLAEGEGALQKHDPEVRRLLSRRPGYREDCEVWALARQSYLGGREWLSARNLPPHLLEMRAEPKAQSSVGGVVTSDQLVSLGQGEVRSAGAPSFETHSEYEMRLSQGFRLNVTRQIVEPLIGLLRQHPATVSLPPVTGLDDYNKEADLGRSESLEEQLNRAIEWASVLGTYYIGIDSSLSREQLAGLLAQAQVLPDEQGRVPASVVPPALAQPHSWLIDPTQILDGRMNEQGTFEELLMVERRHNGKPLGQGGGFELQYRYWTRDFWEVWVLERQGQNLRARRLDAGFNPLGMIPIYRVVIYDVLGRPWRGRAVTEDAVLTDRALAGLASSLFFSLENESDAQVMASTDLSGFDNPNDPALHAFMAQIRETLRSRIGALHKAITPTVLNKSSGQKELMLSTYREVMAMQFRLMGMGDQVDEQQAESGIARLRRQKILSALLTNLADAKATVHRDVLHAATLLLGGDAEQVTRDAVVAPSSFDVKTLSDLMLLHKELRGLVPPEWEKKLLAEIWQQSFGEKPQAWLDESAQELEAWTPPREETSGELMRDLSGVFDE